MPGHDDMPGHEATPDKQPADEMPGPSSFTKHGGTGVPISAAILLNTVGMIDGWAGNL
jgi:hypothetical protein